VLSPEFFRQPDCERADVYCLRPFFLVRLIKRRIKQPSIFYD
jgi:hypothetical protein